MESHIFVLNVFVTTPSWSGMELELAELNSIVPQIVPLKPF